jgi:hypothetical protein
LGGGAGGNVGNEVAHCITETEALLRARKEDLMLAVVAPASNAALWVLPGM